MKRWLQKEATLPVVAAAMIRAPAEAVEIWERRKVEKTESDTGLMATSQ